MSQGKFVATRDSTLQQKVQPTTRSKEDSVTTWKESIVTQSSVLALQGNTTLSRQRKSMSRQQFHATGRNAVATKNSLLRHKLRITTERMSQHSRDYCNKVEELEEEISIVTKGNHVAT